MQAEDLAKIGQEVSILSTDLAGIASELRVALTNLEGGDKKPQKAPSPKPSPKVHKHSLQEEPAEFNPFSQASPKRAPVKPAASPKSHR